MIIGAFEDREHAGMAVDDLESAGFMADRVSVIAKEHGRVEEKRANIEGGTAAGGAIGGLVGLLAGAGVIPALAGLLVGGPIGALLGLTGAAAMAATGAVTGGFIGALVGAGIPRESAEEYNRIVDDGGIIIGASVNNEEEATEARRIFESHGADRIDPIITKD